MSDDEDRRRRIEKLDEAIRHAMALLRNELLDAPPCDCGECYLCRARTLVER